MKKKYYDFHPDKSSMIFTAIFSALTILLLVLSVNPTKKLLTPQSVFLFTPAGCLILLACVSVVILAIRSISHPETVAYLLVPLSIAGILFALRPVLIQGEFSMYLELSGIHFVIATVRGLLGIAVMVFMFLLVTNVLADKKYFIASLLVTALWYLGTESFVYHSGYVGKFVCYDKGLSIVLLAQIGFYCTMLFFAFSIKQTNKQQGYTMNASN